MSPLSLQSKKAVVDVGHALLGQQREAHQLRVGESIRVYRDQPVAQHIDKNNAPRQVIRIALEAVAVVARGPGGSMGSIGGSNGGIGGVGGGVGDTGGGPTPTPTPPPRLLRLPLRRVYRRLPYNEWGGLQRSLQVEAY